MNDWVTFAPIAVSTRRSPRLNVPLGVIGRGLAAFLEAYGRAMELACVEPYSISTRKAPAVPDIGPDGRDPNW